ncbi:cytochrome P450 2J5 [Microcaecilia unicolor]|uniref:Cytochrome P450 2J5-like n=1 Tax=Microcaecilia unicolor TaxID=1415580 RepID=A0A6P7Z5R1_9AMPH|nr:cytochrome P450 2J5-like [Microcaecilia unicolor]XP_030072793.1 cytochrome P450 2J5-like [Microcaecilia unicolor]XP_030072794.1 cytochrome P450 2J5-like [Microcaecilia unicolor]
MLSTVLFLSVLILSVLIAQFLKLQWVGKRLPPGPTPLPFLGNLWTLRFRIDRDSLSQLEKTYGKIYTLWLGQNPAVLVNGYEALRDCLISFSDVFVLRAPSPYFMKIFGDNGITFSNGELWKHNRRFGLMTLRNLGLGNRNMEVRIQEEIRYLLNNYAAKEGRPMNPDLPLRNSVGNVMCAVVFGHRFDTDDKHFLHFMKVFDMVIKFPGTAWGKVYDALSSLMPLLPGPHKKLFACWEEVRSFVREEIKLHQERRVAGDPPEDLIDYYLDEMAKTKDNPTSLCNENNLNVIVAEFFLAGMETTSVTLLWALGYMVDYPDVQVKVQKELDAVLEPSEIIRYEDRKRLPYTNAVIHELQRFASIVQVGVTRMSIKDTKFKGFFIPKGTPLFANIDSALIDPEHWETPQHFNPNHFLDEDGNFVTKEAFIPFSAGLRVCMGEQLARIQLFLFFTNLLREFTFHLPREEKRKITSDYILGSTSKPHPYQICAVSR